MLDPEWDADFPDGEFYTMFAEIERRWTWVFLRTDYGAIFGWRSLFFPAECWSDWKDREPLIQWLARLEKVAEANRFKAVGRLRDGASAVL